MGLRTKGSGLPCPVPPFPALRGFHSKSSSIFSVGESSVAGLGVRSVAEHRGLNVHSPRMPLVICEFRDRFAGLSGIAPYKGVQLIELCVAGMEGNVWVMGEVSTESVRR